ncbi:MAG: RNA degradosome polyphosphate kinase [Muribaculaceae bacterium]|nr:RNA degradosome polyphosphate kinase [Muribaculaceae bacterium]
MSDTHDKTDTLHGHIPYINRDVSWMWFNHRILQEARRKDVPTLERLSFLGIYSNNLDEFYRVRVATLSRVAEMKGKDVKEQSRKAHNLLDRILAIDDEYSKEYMTAIKEVEESLAEDGIEFLTPENVNEEQMHYLKCLFRNQVGGFVSPLWLDHLTGFSREDDSHIYLAVELRGQDLKTAYAIIELPTRLCGRFITLPQTSEGKRYVMYLDDLVRIALPMIFPGMGYTEFKAYSFKFTKDAEMEIDNDLHVGQLQKVAKGVKSRINGQTLRVIYDAEMPQQMLKALMSKLKLSKFDKLKPSGRYHNHKDLMSFPKQATASADSVALTYPVWPQIVKPELKHSHSLLQLIAEKDRFIHVPYHTFDYVVRLLQEAAVSRNVKSIKITLYRVARNSRVVEALMCAARNGKKVTAVVELMARFDEESNIDCAKKMQEAGVNVVFGVEGLKVHSKLILIGMRHGRSIAVVGSGNFHEGNAKTYTDYFMMTGRPAITRDVEEVFNFIRRPYHPAHFRNLLVSPNAMRNHFIQLIDDEIRNAKAGRKAWIKIKINHITDQEMVEKLYEASQAGVDIQLLVRGNFSIVTDVPEFSTDIKAVGIIDRYLEHSRIFIFHAGGENKTFLGSADWMPRNLDNRVEVVTPVFDPELKADLLNTVESGMADNTHGRLADGTGRNLMNPGVSSEPFRSQEALYHRYLHLNSLEK